MHGTQEVIWPVAVMLEGRGLGIRVITDLSKVTFENRNRGKTDEMSTGAGARDTAHNFDCDRRMTRGVSNYASSGGYVVRATCK